MNRRAGRSLVGVVTSLVQADTVIGMLRAAHFPEDCIAALLPCGEAPAACPRIQSLHESSTLAIPGLGAFVSAGTMGPPWQEVAQRYRERIEEGRMLLSVRVAGGDDDARAHKILDFGGATEISSVDA